jgi:hypothetical protein
MGEARRFVSVLALALAGCGPAGGSASEIAEVPLSAEGEKGPPSEGAPKGVWLLDLAADGTGGWIDPAPPPPGVGRRGVMPEDTPSAVRVRLDGTLPWAKVGPAFYGRYQSIGPSTSVWFEGAGHGMRVPITGRRDQAARIALTIALVLDEHEDLVVRVEPQGDAWWTTWGCDEPSTATWRWRGSPDRELSAWLQRGWRAAGRDTSAFLVRIAPVDAAALRPTSAEMLDLVSAVMAEQVAEELDLGWPRYGEGRRRTDAVERALSWLAAHQHEDGHWSAADWGNACDGTRLPFPLPADGSAADDVALTSAAVCAFLGAGYTNRGNHPWAMSTGKGVRWLRDRQRADGRFAASDRDHAWATLAVTELYNHTESPVFRTAALRALEALDATVPALPEDPVTLALTAMALASARIIDEDAAARARPAFWRAQAAPTLVARLERLGHDPDAVARAASLCGLLLLGTDEATVADAIDALPLPAATGVHAHAAYAWLGTIARFRRGKSAWTSWDAALTEHVVNSQRNGPRCCYGGSWDVRPDDPLEGGRVEATALFAMSLEVYYRYDKAMGVR